MLAGRWLNGSGRQWLCSGKSWALKSWDWGYIKRCRDMMRLVWGVKRDGQSSWVGGVGAVLVGTLITLHIFNPSEGCWNNWVWFVSGPHGIWLIMWVHQPSLHPMIMSCILLKRMCPFWKEVYWSGGKSFTSSLLLIWLNHRNFLPAEHLS